MRLLDTSFRNQLDIDEGVVAVDVTSVLKNVRTDARTRKYTATIIEEAPSAMPPFTSMWMEYSRTRKVAVGSYFETFDLRDVPKSDREDFMANVVESMGGDIDIQVKPIEVDSPDHAFGVTCVMYIRDNKGSTVAFGKFAMMLNHQGKNSYPMMIGLDASGRNLMTKYAESGIDPYQSLDAFFFAIGLMHCKNVTIEDAHPAPVKIIEKRARRTGVPPYKYKVLVVGNMSGGATSDDRPISKSSEKMLHICRGHFATYSEDKPLFGRYSGTFWKPAHVRGNADHGTVYKDYKVKAPKE